MLGIAAFNTTSVVGAVYQMLNHGISTGALFFCVGMLYDRRHTFAIAEYGGLKSVMPWFSSLFLLVCLSSLAVPGLNGFVGEFLIMLGSWSLSQPHGGRWPRWAWSWPRATSCGWSSASSTARSPTPSNRSPARTSPRASSRC